MFVWTSAVTFFGLLVQPGPTLSQDTLQESEPNNSQASADTAYMGATASGAVGAGGYSVENPDTVDYWVLYAAAGDTIWVDGEACRTCYDANLVLQLFASDGVTQLASGKFWNGMDPQLSYVTSVSGQYLLRVFANAFGADRLRYRLHFFERKCPEDRNESNNSFATATPLALGSVVNASWCPQGDGDFFSLRLEPGTVLEFSMEGYVHTDQHFDQPTVHLFNARGENLDKQVKSDLGPLRYEVAEGGAYYLQPWSSRGGLAYPYRLHVWSEGQVAPGPGDPVTKRSAGPTSGVLGVLNVDSRANVWFTSLAVRGLVRLSPDSTQTVFKSEDFLVAQDLAADAFGNLLILTPTGVKKFAPPHVVRTVIPTSSNIYGGMAVTSNAIWIANYWMGPPRLQQYDLQGHLQKSYEFTQLRSAWPYRVVIGPSGDPYVSTGSAIYRVSEGELQRVVQQDTALISAFQFDEDGRIYVSLVGDSYTGAVSSSRIALYDQLGQVLIDPFAWWPRTPGPLAFGRNTDGSSNNRLFLEERGLLVEVNQRGISAPGFLAAPPAQCPVLDEGEPNDSPESARAIPPDTTVIGVSCLAGDRDLFRFFAPGGGHISLDLQGADEPILELLGPDGHTSLATSDDTVGFHPRIIYDTKSAGQYYVEVRSRFGGPKPYVLRVGRDRATPPAGLTLTRAAREFVRPGAVLTAEERSYLDLLGNNNGHYDLGDFRAFYGREHPRQGDPP